MRKYIHKTEEEKLANRKNGWVQRRQRFGPMPLPPKKRRPPKCIRTLAGIVGR